MAVGAVFIGGVLTSLTPCIYPMIPITAAIVGGQSATHTASNRRTASLTFSYVFGLALAYAILGLIAGLTGQLFGAISTNPWLYFALANLLVVFGFMMLEMIPVPVPRGLLRRAAALEGGGRIASVFGMGAASGLVAAPCGAPVMATLLTWVSLTRRAGGVVRLPRAGAWMVWVKRGFAIVMFGVAEYYLVQMGTLLS